MHTFFALIVFFATFAMAAYRWRLASFRAYAARLADNASVVGTV